MIHELQDVITWMLERMPLKGFGISFDQPTQQWAARLQKATVNAFLYDIRDNPILQPRMFAQINNGQGEDHKVVEKRSPLRMDCFYLITAWGIDDKKAMTEQHLLSQCICTLARFPLLNPDRIQDVKGVSSNDWQRLKTRVKGKQIDTIQQEIRARLAGHDVLPNPAEIWSSLATPIRPSLSYVVNLPIDPWKPEEFTELVETSTPLLGLAEWSVADSELVPAAPIHRNSNSENSEPIRRPNVVFGDLKDNRTEEAKNKSPVRVYLVDLDDKTKTRLAKIADNGRFVFTHVPSGRYTLQAKSDRDILTEKDVLITQESHLLKKSDDSIAPLGSAQNPYPLEISS